LDYRAQTVEHYSQIFGESGGGPSELGEKWGWYVALYTLANEDVLQMEAVTSLPVGSVFTHLSFLQDLNYHREKQMKQARA
jgi:hypothetical protein